LNILLPPAPYWSAYQASKSAFDQWLRCILAELHFKNIATTVLYLPLVKTRMIEPTVAYKNAPAMMPEQVAQLIGKAIVQKNRKFVPWWGYIPLVLGIWFRSFWEYITIWYIRRKKRIV
jgi:short-subunit dehydrogenase